MFTDEEKYHIMQICRIRADYMQQAIKDIERIFYEDVSGYSLSEYKEDKLWAIKSFINDKKRYKTIGIKIAKNEKLASTELVEFHDMIDNRIVWQESNNLDNSIIKKIEDSKEWQNMVKLGKKSIRNCSLNTIKQNKKRKYEDKK